MHSVWLCLNTHYASAFTWPGSFFCFALIIKQWVTVRSKWTDGACSSQRLLYIWADIQSQWEYNVYCISVPEKVCQGVGLNEICSNETCDVMFICHDDNSSTWWHFTFLPLWSEISFYRVQVKFALSFFALHTVQIRSFMRFWQRHKLIIEPTRYQPPNVILSFNPCVVCIDHLQFHGGPQCKFVAPYLAVSI